MNRIRRLLLSGFLFSMAFPWLAAAQLQVCSTRALDPADDPSQKRATIMVLVRNAGNRPVTIQSLKLQGRPLAELLARATDKKAWEGRYSYGGFVDWFDLRPQTIPAGGAGMIILGMVKPDLLQPKVALTAVTDMGLINLSFPPPEPDRLKVARVTFDPELKQVFIFARNDGRQPIDVQGLEVNGKALKPEIKGSPVAPGMVAQLAATLPEPLAFAQDVSVLVRGNQATGTAWTRAYPAESLTYPFGGSAERRDLKEKNMDLAVTHAESSPPHNDAINVCTGEAPAKFRQQLAARAQSFGKDPRSWVWYLRDDAGWGRPPPQALVYISHWLRAAGSPQWQWLCNPADNGRYAWLSEMYVNYSYHTTHQCKDPTLFTGGRSIELMRKLNDPAPIAFLVDAVGQGAAKNTTGTSFNRWIARGEEEQASYAMLGRGATHLGWFMGPSLYEQEAGGGGGWDPEENLPNRFQQGFSANQQIGSQIGNIAGFFKALSPYIATDTPLPVTQGDGIEVFPLVCKDDVMITGVQNRKFECLYPPAHAVYGEYRVVPQRNVAVSHALPSWIKPEQVVAFDQDRGFRPVPFAVERGRLVVRLDALDTAVALLAVPNARILEEIQTNAAARMRPAAGGSAVRPHGVFAAKNGALAPARGQRYGKPILGEKAPADSFLFAGVNPQFGANGLTKLKLSFNGKAQSAYVEARNAEGTLLAWKNLRRVDDQTFDLGEPLPIPKGGVDVLAWGVGANDVVIALELRAPPAVQPLTEIAKVNGQVETIACPKDGRWVLVGADKVYAFDDKGKEAWTVDLGANRRQPDFYGPGLNVEQVGVRADGAVAFARTFQWDSKKGLYEPAYMVILGNDGKQIAKTACFWRMPAQFNEDGNILAGRRAAKTPSGLDKGAPIVIDARTGGARDVVQKPTPGIQGPVASNGRFKLFDRWTSGTWGKGYVEEDGARKADFEWPPYAHHKQLLANGSVVAGTTQGIIQFFDADGKMLWEVRRPSRIDGMILAETRDAVIMAYKQYPHRWDWWSIPTVEALSLKDGSSIFLAEGQANHDYGHYGAHLALAASADGARIYFGDPMGRIYLAQWPAK